MTLNNGENSEEFDETNWGDSFNNPDSKTIWKEDIEIWKREDISEDWKNPEEQIAKLQRELEEAREKEQKWRDRAKRWYTKHDDYKKKTVTFEDLEAIEKRQQEFYIQREALLDKYPDAKDHIMDIKNISDEKGLSYEEAYLLRFKDKYLDPQKQFQDWIGRVWFDWDFGKQQAQKLADKILSQKPKILQW